MSNSKLTFFSTKKPSLLCLASHISGFIISTECLPQTNNIKASSRPVASKITFTTSHHRNLNWKQITGKFWLFINHNHQLKIVQIKSLLVCNVGFRLNAFICIVACLVIVEISDMDQVFIDLIGFSSVDISSQNISTLHLVLLVLLLLFSPRSYKKL